MLIGEGRWVEDKKMIVWAVAAIADGSNWRWMMDGGRGGGQWRGSVAGADDGG